MESTLHLVCPHCRSVNRMPSERLAQHPVCGNCRQPLFTGHPLELDADAFARHLSRDGIPLLVDFWAPWCGPCKIMAPAFEQAATVLEPGIRVAKVNTESEPMLANRYGIRSIPTLALFREGREIARQAGAMGAQEIVRWAHSQLGVRY